MKKVILLILFTSCWAAWATGQGWQRHFGKPDELESGRRLTRTPDGGFLLRQEYIAGVQQDYQTDLLRLDAEGKVLWQYALGTLPSGPFPNSYAEGPALLSPEGEVFLSFQDSLYKFDAGGNLQLRIQSNYYHTLGVQSDGIILLQGSLQNDSLKLRKYNFNGMLVWDKKYKVSGTLKNVVLAPDGGIVALCHYSGTRLYKYGPAGNQQWTHDYAETYFYVDFDNSGNILLSETYLYAPGSPNNQYLILKASPGGSVLWTHTLLISNDDVARQLIPTPDGGYLIIGSTYYDDIDNPRLYRLDPDGNEIWTRYLATARSTLFEDIQGNPDGSFVVSGRVNETSELANSATDAIVWKFNAEGILYPNLLKGRIIGDYNLDCDVQPNETGMPNWKVEMNGLLAVTDQEGRFEFQVDSGTTEIILHHPGQYWDPCPGYDSYTFNGVFQTDTLDIPIKPLVDCPQMEVGIGFPFLRRCFENTATVNWCNVGTAPSPETQILVVLPPELDFSTASWPPSQVIGDSLWFDIGLVGANDCGSFQLTAVVNCDSTELGEGLCVEAHIFPDTFCMPLPEWTGANVQLEADCIGDTLVQFRLRNTGNAATSPGLDYIVIEDQVVLSSAPFSLPPFGEVVVNQPVSIGNLYRLEADQEPFHPGLSMPSVWVEGCGMPNQGLALQYAVDDRDLFIDIDCHRVVASYDPNDKNALPEGYSTEHLVEPNTDLSYRIRFQNTGTDTAFTVIVRDTLSAWLDPASVRAEGASHPFTWDIVDGNTLKFVFNNILLPDSSTNEPASNGFVQFRVSQKPDVPSGNVIYNRAAIYFDFNPAVLTNETFHTVGHDFILVTSDATEPGGMAYSVGPNPFREETTFRFDAVMEGTFSLYNLRGQVLRQETVSGPEFHFQRRGLPGGMYGFDIRGKGRVVASGKLVMQ